MNLGALFPILDEGHNWISHDRLDIVNGDDVKGWKVIHLQNIPCHDQNYLKTKHDGRGGNQTHELRASPYCQVYKEYDEKYK